MPQNTKREIAYKISIDVLKKYPYHQQEGWLPNYVEYGDKKISRINIIAAVILKSDVPEQNMVVVDDGTDQIDIRTFENDFDFNKFDIGDFVVIIGRIREFNNNKYIVPEIMKKIEDNKLIELRKKEQILEKSKHVKIEELSKNEKRKLNLSNIKEKIIGGNKNLDIYTKILNEIKKVDIGQGASIQEVLVNTDLINKDELITELLEKGDIFEISPGNVKVLE